MSAPSAELDAAIELRRFAATLGSDGSMIIAFHAEYVTIAAVAVYSAPSTIPAASVWSGRYSV